MVIRMHVTSQGVMQTLYMNGMGAEGIIIGMAHSPDLGNCFFY